MAHGFPLLSRTLNFVLIELCFCLLLFRLVFEDALPPCVILSASPVSSCCVPSRVHSVCASRQQSDLSRAVSQLPTPSTHKLTRPSWLCAVSFSTLGPLPSHRLSARCASSGSTPGSRTSRAALSAAAGVGRPCGDGSFILATLLTLTSQHGDPALSLQVSP